MVKLMTMNINKVDLAANDSELVPTYNDSECSKVPKFKHIPDYYRSRLAAYQRKLGKAVDKTVRDIEEPTKRASTVSNSGTPKKRPKKRREPESEEESQPEDSDAPSTPKLSEEETDDDWSD